jgi:hypothetical protein
MRNRWRQISSVDDRRWTVATWIVFLGLFLLYGASLWFLTGLGPSWLSAISLGVCAVFEPTAMRLSARLFPLIVAAVIVSVPLAVCLIPTLGTLLYIMKKMAPPKTNCNRTQDG